MHSRARSCARARTDDARAATRPRREACTRGGSSAGPRALGRRGVRRAAARHAGRDTGSDGVRSTGGSMPLDGASSMRADAAVDDGGVGIDGAAHRRVRCGAARRDRHRGRPVQPTMAVSAAPAGRQRGCDQARDARPRRACTPLYSGAVGGRTRASAPSRRRTHARTHPLARTPLLAHMHRVGIAVPLGRCGAARRDAGPSRQNAERRAAMAGRVPAPDDCSAARSPRASRGVGAAADGGTRAGGPVRAIRARTRSHAPPRRG